MDNLNLPWYEEWAWVGGYSSVATLVIIFNILLVVAVAKNSFLHYSFHYVMVMLSIRWFYLQISLLLYVSSLKEHPSCFPYSQCAASCQASTDSFSAQTLLSSSRKHL